MKLPHFHDQPTLQITFPLGQTLVLALLILALMVGTAEAFARVFLDDSDLPMAVGSDNLNFDVKIGVLDQLVKEKGGVDCIFLGSSVVLNGIDPAAFETAYQAQTGESITCFNFGVLALTARTGGVLAELLIERYHPRLLVYGLTPRDVAARASDVETIYNGIVHTPWVEYRRGSFNVQGWLVEHLAVYRHYLAYRVWTTPDFTNRLHDFTDAPRTGYQPFLPTRPFDPDTIQTPDFLTDFQIAPADWAGLEDIAAVRSAETEVLLVEMPLPAFLLDDFQGGAEGYYAFFDRAEAMSDPYGVPVWLSSPLDLIPDNGWAEDGHHVNHLGAQVFSRWLGAKVGQAVKHGDLPTLPATVENPS